MSQYTEKEEQFIRLHQQLSTIAQAAAQAKVQLMGAYIEAHYPGVVYEITVERENVLALDVVFPGLGEPASRQLGQELSEYLQRLVNSGEE